MVAIREDHYSDIVRVLFGFDILTDAQDLLNRIIEDMPDDVAKAILNDIHKDFDYE